MQPIAALTLARRAQGIAAGLVVVGSACVGREAAIAATLGGGLMALHFTLLLILARLCLQRGSGNSLPAAAMLMFTKFCVMAALTAAVLLVIRPHPVGFVAGLATFMVGMAGAIVGHRQSFGSSEDSCAQRF